MTMERRNFLKVLGAGSASIAAFSCRDQEAARRITADQGALQDVDLTWSKAPCRYCGTGCGVEVGVKGGRILAVRGDEASPVNRGMLCVKGYHLPAMLYGEDRLLYPMLRNEDGRGFSRISWDEALDLIARKYQEALDEAGPESVAFYGSGQWGIHDGYAVTKWFRGGLRSNNVEPNARLCMASAVMGFMTQFQSDEPMGCYEDFEAGDDFILWGNNMAEMHPVLFSRILANKRENSSVRIVDIGTRRTPTTDYADLYVEFKPNTDLALANGILHLLVKNGQVDQPFIRENVVFRRGIEELDQIGYGSWGPDGLGLRPEDGPAEHYSFADQARESSFTELEAFLEDYTPDRVSEISGVPEGQIHALAQIYGDRGRGTVSLWCMGVNQHVRGTWMNNLITDLHLLTGKISRPGANPFSLTGQPSACGTAREVGTLANRLPADLVVTNPEHRARAEEIWGLEPGTIPATPGYHTMDLFRAFMRGDVKVMWVQTTNPWVSVPNANRIQREPGDGRFLIVS
ncbi:MAG: molybdopterin-dependent oxidoreductase, partial [Gemmatimonadota bacterium]